MSSSVNSDSGEAQNSTKYDEEDFLSSPLLEEVDEDVDDLVIPLISAPKISKKSSKKKSTKRNDRKRRNASPSLSPLDSDDDSMVHLTKKSSKQAFREEDDGLSTDPETSAINRNLTKRQKAKYLDEHEEELLELKEESRKKHFTAEELALRRSETARRRKHQSQQKAEKDKLETINRLLKKQANKKSRADQKMENNEESGEKVSPPTEIRYILKPNGEASLSFPEEFVHLIDNLKQTANYPAEKQGCMVEGCGLSKKYCHPDTRKISCSWEHYKQLL